MGFNLNLGKFENFIFLNIYRKKWILNRNGYCELILYFYLYVYLYINLEIGKVFLFLEIINKILL